MVLPSPLAVDRNARSNSGFGRHGAGLCIGQFKHIAAGRGREHRQPRDVAHHLAQLGVLGVHLAGSVLDGDGELGFAEFELDVQPQVVGQAEALRGDSGRLKTGCFDFDKIFPRHEIRYAVEAGVSRGGGVNRRRCRIGRPHARANDNGVTRISDSPYDGAGDALCRRFAAPFSAPTD